MNHRRLNVQWLYMATRQFSDWFTYRAYERDIKGKIFYDCVLLKDFGFEYTHEGSEVSDIMIDSILGHMWVPIPGSSNMAYEYVEVSLVKPNVPQMMHDTTLPFDELEDVLGVVMHTGSFFNIVSDAYDLLRTHRLRSIRLIKDRWKFVVSNPRFKVCRDRLSHEFYEMVF